MGNLILNGFLQAGGDGCGCGSGAGGTTETLGLRCSPGTYQSIVGTDSPIAVRTTGVVGAEFVDLSILGDFIAIEFLYLKTNTAMRLRIDGETAKLQSNALTLPTGFVGGEVLTLDIDGTTVTTTFLIGDQTLAQVVARINAAMALAGLATPRVIAVGTTKIEVDAIAVGVDSTIEVLATPASIPFPITEAVGSGQLLDVAGTFLVEFPTYPDSPTRVEISGQGSVTILAAGRTTV